MEKNKLPHNTRTGFKVPEGYFEDLQARIVANATSSEPIRSGGLDDVKHENPFKVPENYFENFEGRLSERLEQQPRSSKVISLFNKESLYYVAGVAAVFVALVTTFLTESPQEISWDSLDLVTLEEYLHERMDNSTGDFSQMFSENESTFSSSATDIDQEAVLDYLNENMEDPTVLLNED